MASLLHPLKGQGVLTSTRGWRGSGADRHWHKGIDIAAPEGTPVYAAAAGTVVHASPASSNTGYGNSILIQHSPKLFTRYSHLSHMLVKAGQSVARGQHIGAVGNTGLSFGSHLDFEVKTDDSYNRTDIDPLPLIENSGALDMGLVLLLAGTAYLFFV